MNTQHPIGQQAVWGRWVGGAPVTEMPKEVTLLGSKFRQQISGMEWTPHPRRAAHGAVAGLGVPVHGVRGLEEIFHMEPGARAARPRLALPCAERLRDEWLGQADGRPRAAPPAATASGWPWGVDGDR